jgi:plasmid stabilization system protein ParE
MKRILRTPQADSDLAGVWSHIAADNPGAADRLIQQINADFHLLAD